MQNTFIEIYTDGSSLKNPGNGGWSFVRIDHRTETVDEMIGFEMDAPNNKMELIACVKALESTPFEKDVTIVIKSDSAYVVNGATEWLPGWIRRGWVTAVGEEVKHLDLWKTMQSELAKRFPFVKFEKIAAHSGEMYNERCDYLAKTAAFTQSQNPFLVQNFPLKDYNEYLLKMSQTDSKKTKTQSRTKSKSTSLKSQKAITKTSIVNSQTDKIINKIATHLTSDHTKIDLEATSETPKKRSNNRKKAFCFVVLTHGQVYEESDWINCQKRMKGDKKAIYQKVMTEAERDKYVAKFNSLATQSSASNSPLVY